MLFDYVRLKKEEVRFDRQCVAGALHAAAALDFAPRVHVNVHAATLERDAQFAQFLESAASSAAVHPSRLTIELVE